MRRFGLVSSNCVLLTPTKLLYVEAGYYPDGRPLTASSTDYYLGN